MKKTIPIFFAVDDNYCTFMQIAMKSIITNASKDYKYKIHVLNNGLSEKSIEMLEALSNENFSFEFNNVASCVAGISDDLRIRDYYTKAIYYRLFIPNLFKHYDKALYLDADIIVREDISKLYNYNIGDNLLGAVADEAVGIVPEFISYVNKYLGIHESKYFNSGILVMNLKELRKQKFEETFLNLLKQIQFIIAPDQDFLNVICKDKVTYISNSWNKMPLECNNVPVENVSLIHYNLSFKPWKHDNILYNEEFWKYAEMNNVKKEILAMKENFTEEQKRADLEGGEKLRNLALEFSNIEDTFTNQVKNGGIVF